MSTRHTVHGIPESTFKAGDVVDAKWVILEFIGRGGMGEVYRAHQLNLNRDVAIKIISQQWLRDISDNTYEAETCLERFRREVQVMAQVRHRNVLQIFDYGSVSITRGGDGESAAIEYLIMEYIPGATLRSTMSAEGFHPEEDRMREWLTKYFVPLLEGVQALHELGIIHRDLKPENVLLDRDIPKIADFGLARSCRLKPVTLSMDIKGTPPYMSPEHFMDLRRTDQRTDVYSLGKILFEAASGRMSSDLIPFKQAGLKGPDTPFFRKLDEIIRTATVEDRNERLSSAEALKEALEALPGNLTEASIPPGPAQAKTSRSLLLRLAGGAGILVLAGTVALGSMFFHDGGSNTEPTMMAPFPGSLQGQAPGEGNQPPGLQSVAPGNPLPSVLHGEDHTILRLVPGGTLTLHEDAGHEGNGSVEVQSFYMDETLVTNHQYVRFLNRALAGIEIENGMVKGDGELWMLLGEVRKGYEPIVFMNGEFHVHGAQHAACPVVRVTGYGASAYARFYGRRLATEEEWLYAASGGSRPEGEHPASLPGSPGARDGDDPHTHHSNMPPFARAPAAAEQPVLPFPSPVMLARPNSRGIRGLNEKPGEWGVRLPGHSGGEEDQQAEYIAFNGLSNYSDHDMGFPAGIRRYPWEAFEGVGFRTVMTAGAQSGS